MYKQTSTFMINKYYSTANLYTTIHLKIICSDESFLFYRRRNREQKKYSQQKKSGLKLVPNSSCSDCWTHRELELVLVFCVVYKYGKSDRTQERQRRCINLKKSHPFLMWDCGDDNCRTSLSLQKSDHLRVIITLAKPLSIADFSQLLCSPICHRILVLLARRGWMAGKAAG